MLERLLVEIGLSSGVHALSFQLNGDAVDVVEDASCTRRAYAVVLGVVLGKARDVHPLLAAGHELPRRVS